MGLYAADRSYAGLVYNFGNINWQVTVIKYEVILYWSDVDSAFIAEVPELPGCMADGATYL